MNRGQLPIEHVAGLLAEAGRLQREASRLRDAGELILARETLQDARVLAEDAASYSLPSGMRLSTEALIASVEAQLNDIGATPCANHGAGLSPKIFGRRR